MRGNKFILDKPFGRMDIAELLSITKSPISERLQKLLSVGFIPSVKGKGTYQFSFKFFE